MKLAYAQQMRQLDEIAINTYGIPGIVLMENAGVGTIQAINDTYGSLEERTIIIIAGPGNNGGDGLVIARQILQQGGFPIVFLLVDPEEIKGDSATNLQIVRNLDIPIYPIIDIEQVKGLQNYLAECDLIIDAIFGTGLKRSVEGHYEMAISLVNHSLVPVISADIPSGLDSDTGLPLGICIEANLTVTYGLGKPGHFTGSGPEFCGQLGIIDIGIPPAAVMAAELQTEVLTENSITCWLPERTRNSHKGSCGHLLALAGSRGKTGAALLCARAALRAGAGLATICVPQDINHIFESALAEAMTLPLTLSDNGYASVADYDEITNSLKDKQALVMGPGLGQEETTGQLVARLYQESAKPMVIDADGLNLLDTSLLPDNPAGPRILTPHPGEMSRLTGKTTTEIQCDRLQIARDFATSHKVIVVLKGANTIIADPNGRVAINPTGNPILAAGGSGDVLTGFIGAFLVQGLPPWEATCLAVYLHGLAADYVARENNIQAGMLASELADILPAVISDILAAEEE